MRFARLVVLAFTVALAAGPGGTGCSCKDGGTVADDLNLLAEPSNLSFGTVALGTTKALSVTLTHVGQSGVIELGDVTLEGLSDEFTLAGPGTRTLAVGEKVTLTVTYVPLASVASDGALVIRHNVAVLGNETSIPVTALAQVGELYANPNPIDFGEVDGGSDKTLDVSLTNQGTDTVTVNQVYLRLDGSLDFEVVSLVLPDGDALPVTLAPGGSLGLVLRYTPTESGGDESKLVVEGETQGQFSAWSFDVLGKELGPHLVAMPGQLDFGGVPLDTAKDLLLQVSNEGNADLVIPAGGLTFWPDSDPGIVVKDPPAADISIAPGASHDFTVSWTPTVVEADDGEPIGRLMIASNDLAQSPTAIPIFGHPDAPILVVIPEQVDLGFGAQMTPVERQVTLQNAGTGLLSISSMAVVDVVGGVPGVDEFEIVHGAAKGMSVGGFDIAGLGQDVLKVVFTNRGADEGTVTATLRIVSNHKGSETKDVSLTVRRAGSPVCNVAIVPAGINFGVVAVGWPKEMPFNLVNIGTGFCSLRNLMVVDCPTDLFGGVTCGEPLKGVQSQVFKMLNPPPLTMNGLAPGSMTTITMRFTPPVAAPVLGGLRLNAALLSLQVRDELLGKVITLPAGTGTPVTYKPNVQAYSGIAKVSVLPGEVKFGVTTIGCYSKTYKVCIYNSGNAPLTVSDIALQGCTPEVHIKNVPKLPVNVPNGVPKCFDVNYSPQDEDTDKCVVRIDSTDTGASSIAVPLSGSGTKDPHQVDEFTQVTGQEVDILFVIDDSGSMMEEQQQLAESFDHFIQHAEVWDNDYHLGAISVDVVDEPVIGRLGRGDPKVVPRYMTPTSGGNFAKMVDYGSPPPGGQNSSAQESGLQAAQAALSSPLSTDTGIACAKSADCKNDVNVCPDPAACAYDCVDGTCGGWNKGFLREDAQLELIVLSDEEDQSSGSLPFYIDFLKNIKGWYNVDMMHFNAIVGAVGGVAQSCTAGSGQDSTAAAGKRYVDAANQTGGLVDSICLDNYGPVMNDIGEVSFHPRFQFFLTRLADPATVSVEVRGAPCTTGWRYDAPSNSVIFDKDGACMPGPGDAIRIEYDTLCLTS